MKNTIYVLMSVMAIPFIVGCSDKSTPVEKDVRKAIEIVSTSTEMQSKKLQQGFELVKVHPEKEAIAALISWLDSDSETQRRAAVYTLQMIGWEDASSAFPELRKLLTHQEAKTRGMTAMALASLGDAESYATIEKMLSDEPDAYARRCAAWALGELNLEKALEPLNKALSDPDVSVQGNVNNAIQRLNFSKKYKDVKGNRENVIRGVWLVSGSTLNQLERLDRAVDLIRKCPEHERHELIKELSQSDSPAIRNSVAYARNKL